MEEPKVSMVPEDDKARKMLPLFRFYTGYFPKAMREMTKVSVVNNVRYNPGSSPADISWARGKSTDQLGSAFRHMVESRVDGKVFEAVPTEIAQLTGIERVYVLAEAMWRLGAELELTIEKEEAKELTTTQAEAQRATVDKLVADVIAETERINGAFTAEQMRYAKIVGYNYFLGQVAADRTADVFSIHTAHPEGCFCDACLPLDKGD